MASSDDIVKSLKELAKGLLFPSESDKPVKVLHVKEEKPGTTVDAAVLQAVEKLPSEVSIHSLSVEEFFAPVTTLQDWYGDEEKERTARFQALVKALQENLTGLQAFRVAKDGATTIDAYVIGRAAEGDIVGVQTQLIET